MKIIDLFRKGRGEDSKKTSDEREISIIVGNTLVSVAEQGRQEVKRLASLYMEEKKQQYSGSAYVAQLEKNYVYLELCTKSIANHIGLFLLGLEKPPREEFISDVLDQIRARTKDETSAHIQYISSECKGCKYHIHHERYNNIRQSRLTDMKTYIEELESGCHFNKASLTISQACLYGLWNKVNSHLAGTIAADSRQLSQMVYMYLEHATTCVLNDSSLRNERGGLMYYVAFN